MKALLLIAHGSHLIESNQAIAVLIEKLNSMNHQKYDQISYAFLEFTKPTIADSIKDLIQLGTKEITIFPYFLSPGKHVKDDIPALISSLTQNHPDIKITILPHFGSLPTLPEFIANYIFNL